MKCLKCHGDNVHVHSRGFNLISGFIGSNKLIATCLDCGYKNKAINTKSKDYKTKIVKKCIRTFIALLIFFSIIIIAKIAGII